jgi:phosphoserine aminotransferase
MKKVIFQLLEDTETGEKWMNWANSWREAHKETFSPLINTLFVTDFKIKGKNYKERKENARALAIDFQNAIINSNIDFSYYDLMMQGAQFERIAKSYGLVEEYKENGII